MFISSLCVLYMKTKINDGRMSHLSESLIINRRLTAVNFSPRLRLQLEFRFTGAGVKGLSRRSSFGKAKATGEIEAVTKVISPKVTRAKD